MASTPNHVSAPPSFVAVPDCIWDSKGGSWYITNRDHALALARKKQGKQKKNKGKLGTKTGKNPEKRRKTHISPYLSYFFLARGRPR